MWARAPCLCLTHVWAVWSWAMISPHVARSSSQWKSLSPAQLFATPWTAARQAPLSMEFSRQEYWSGYHSFFQGTFPTQGWNPGLLHCRWILYQSAMWETCLPAKHASSDILHTPTKEAQSKLKFLHGWKWFCLFYMQCLNKNLQKWPEKIRGFFVKSILVSKETWILFKFSLFHRESPLQN